MASIEGGDNLREYVPDVVFRRVLFLRPQLLDDSTKVSSTAVFHVKMKVLTISQVIAVVVADDVRVL